MSGRTKRDRKGLLEISFEPQSEKHMSPFKIVLKILLLI